MENIHFSLNTFLTDYSELILLVSIILCFCVCIILLRISIINKYNQNNILKGLEILDSNNKKLELSSGYFRNQIFSPFEILYKIYEITNEIAKNGGKLFVLSNHLAYGEPLKEHYGQTNEKYKIIHQTSNSNIEKFSDMELLIYRINNSLIQYFRNNSDYIAVCTKTNEKDLKQSLLLPLSKGIKSNEHLMKIDNIANDMMRLHKNIESVILKTSNIQYVESIPFQVIIAEVNSTDDKKTRSRCLLFPNYFELNCLYKDNYPSAALYFEDKRNINMFKSLFAFMSKNK